MSPVPTFPHPEFPAPLGDDGDFDEISPHLQSLLSSSKTAIKLLQAINPTATHYASKKSATNLVAEVSAHTVNESSVSSDSKSSKANDGRATAVEKLWCRLGSRENHVSVCEST